MSHSFPPPSCKHEHKTCSDCNQPLYETCQSFLSNGAVNCVPRCKICKDRPKPSDWVRERETELMENFRRDYGIEPGAAAAKIQAIIDFLDSHAH